jgi:hypothetical protein
MDKLADKQNKLAENERRILPINKNINSEFKNIQDEKERDNAELKSPVDLPDDVATEKISLRI